jgi:hypothetical protein
VTLQVVQLAWLEPSVALQAPDDNALGNALARCELRDRRPLNDVLGKPAVEIVLREEGFTGEGVRHLFI